MRFNNKLGLFVLPVPDPPAWAVDALSHLGKSGGKVVGLPVQENHPDCEGVAQHALVLGSSGQIKLDPSVPDQPAQSSSTAFESDSSQESVKPRFTCLVPRASAIKEQGFSEAA